METFAWHFLINFLYDKYNNGVEGTYTKKAVFLLFSFSLRLMVEGWPQVMLIIKSTSRLNYQHVPIKTLIQAVAESTD